jgi:hypothetical protein
MVKKIFNWYLDQILSNFKWYRRKKGGKWYKIVSEVSGIASPTVEWARKPPHESDIDDLVMIEDYDKE